MASRPQNIKLALPPSASPHAHHAGGGVSTSRCADPVSNVHCTMLSLKQTAPNLRFAKRRARRTTTTMVFGYLDSINKGNPSRQASIATLDPHILLFRFLFCFFFVVGPRQKHLPPGQSPYPSPPTGILSGAFLAPQHSHPRGLQRTERPGPSPRTCSARAASCPACRRWPWP